MPLAVRFRAAVSLLGRFPALAGVDLDVAVGEIVLLQGPNGAGKTTLLRACAGLVPISDGEAEVLGCDLRKDRRAVRRRVGMLGHATFLYDDLTVADNLRFSARAAGLRGPNAMDGLRGPNAVDGLRGPNAVDGLRGPNAVDGLRGPNAMDGLRDLAAAQTAMEQLGLDGRLRNLPVSKLSAGQRRRVALAAVLARKAELWLLDEPHAGLDAAGRELLDGLIREAAAAGATVLLASHELDRATALASRLVTIAGGRANGGLLRPPAATEADAGTEPEAARVS